MRTGRARDELRPVRIERGYTEMTPGSVLIEMGNTRVLCTATVQGDLPRWMRDSGKGWITAEYGMLPGSTRERVPRSAQTGGRSKEIQRLIGRALRAAVDLESLGEVMIRVDCDVLQADGGTRTASITGAWVALRDALTWAAAEGLVDGDPMIDHCAAVSVGVVGDEVLLDLDYSEDVTAEVDFNVVMTGSGGLVEVQGTAEGRPYSRAQLDDMLDLAAEGIRALVVKQSEAVLA